MIRWSRYSKWIGAAALAVGTTSAFAGRITLYEGEDFQGHYVTTNDSMALVGSPAFSNAASSLVVTEGIWEACTDAYFRGRCVQLLPGEYPKVDVNLNGRIASVRQVEDTARAAAAVLNPPQVVVNPTPVVIDQAPVVVGARPVVVRPAPALISPPTAVVVNAQPVIAVVPPLTGRAILYEYPNFGGASAAVDRGQAKDLDWANFSNGHRAMSARVESGTWMFCSEMTFQGECRIFAPGEYPQLSGPLVSGVSSAQQIRRAEYGALTFYTR